MICLSVKKKPNYPRELHKNGPHLHKPCHIIALFNFANTFLDKENCFLEQVLCTDERKIDHFQYNNAQIWHKKGEPFFSKNTAQLYFRVKRNNQI